MASGDLPKDFPLKEANLLGPMIHLLLDKVEEMARMNELPPQYPNDQDKYDADVWTLAPNKPDYFKSGIEFVRQRDSIIKKPSDAISLSIIKEKPETPNVYTNSEDATQIEKSSRIFPMKKSSKDFEITKNIEKERLEAPQQFPKVMQKTAGVSRKSAKARMKVYRAVPSRLKKWRKSAPGRLPKSRSTPSSKRRKIHSSMKDLKKHSTRLDKQEDDILRRQKATIRLKDYFDGINPNNPLYCSVFKLRREELKIKDSQRETKKMKVDKIHRKSTNTTIKSIKRSDLRSMEMVDMPTEANIPCCPVHKAPPLCSNILQRFELPMDYHKKTFDYQIRAWKDNQEILLPSKVSVRRVPSGGVDLHFIVDTSALPGVKPFILRAYCPNYEASRVWINGELCFR